MRKIFTLAAAFLASVSLWAQDAVLDVAEEASAEGYVAVDLTNNNPKSLAYVAYNGSGSGSNDAFMNGTSRWKLSSSRTISFKVVNCVKVELNCFFTKDATTSVNYSINGGEAVEFITNGSDKKCEKSGEFETDDAGEILITISATNDVLLGVIKFYAGAVSDDPVLKVNPAEVDLNASAKNPVASATVVFSGKNLEPGSYALVLPNLAGLSAMPEAVEVDENGKLNAEVTLIYAPEADAEAATTAVSLTIGELSQEVAVNYSAAMTVVKNFLNRSVNIEQWIMDHGKDNAAFQEVLREANIEFENIDELDSLRSDKNNEPFLGLKLKKAGAYVACWIKAGDRIAVKFGALKDAVKIGVNGQYQELPANDNGGDIIERTAEVDEYVEIVTKSDKTIVIKQIMLNEDIQTLGMESIQPAVSSQKILRNGQLLIEKNGVIYNAQGTIIQ